MVGVGAPEAIDPITGLPIPGTRDPWEQSQSPAHRTHMGGSTQDGMTASGIKYLTSSEMCGTCHDLTVPTLNSGMPEQRTYTEWKYSTYGTPGSPNFVICQDCHMGEGQHEYQDGAAGTYKADGAKAGWFPFAKPRPASAIHRFSPANRDLPQILKLLNPDVDMEITGRPTGRDTRTVSGVLSNRDEAWNRHSRYGELKLRDAARVQVLGAPAEVSPGVFEVQVKVTNLSGHALPSGYPDGRRAFVVFKARDANGNVLYQSGDYDLATAELHTAPGVPLARAHDSVIDAAAGKNAVMVYEKRTGYPNPDGTYTMGESLLNPVILFDNRLRPDGWTAELFTAGVRLVDYSGTETSAVPFNKPDRYPLGQGFDVITYRFTVPAGAVPVAGEAEFYYQSHTREFVEYLKDRNNEETAQDLATGRTPKMGGPRPEGTPSILAPGYPNTPNYLGSRVGIPGRLDLAGKPLQDNWGSLVYAAWLDTGKGEPFLIDSDGSNVAAPPAAPATVTASAIDPFAIQVGWTPVADAAGYFVQVRFGTALVDPTYGPTASWEPLAIVRGATSFRHEGLHVAKTYGYRVIAFNGKGEGPPSAPAEATTPAALATAPSGLVATATAPTSVSLQWQDNAIDETGFVVERRDGAAGAFAPIATVAPVSVLGTGTVGFVDGSVLEGRTYGYRIAATSAAGPTYSNVAQVTTPATLPGCPVAPRRHRRGPDHGHSVLAGRRHERDRVRGRAADRDRPVRGDRLGALDERRGYRPGDLHRRHRRPEHRLRVPRGGGELGRPVRLQQRGDGDDAGPHPGRAEGPEGDRGAEDERLHHLEGPLEQRDRLRGRAEPGRPDLRSGGLHRRERPGLQRDRAHPPHHLLVPGEGGERHRVVGLQQSARHQDEVTRRSGSTGVRGRTPVVSVSRTIEGEAPCRSRSGAGRFSSHSRSARQGEHGRPARRTPRYRGRRPAR